MSRRVALITGASAGIGRAAARTLALDGWEVVLVARTESKLEELREQIEAAGGKAHVAAHDASDGDAVLAAAERLRGQGIVPQLIVNSAGAGQWKYIEQTPPSEAETMMGAPYFAAYNTTHAWMQDMLDEGHGHVIHIGSPAAWIPWPGATGYTAARWALRGLHESLKLDLVGTGVTSTIIVFGEVTSEYFNTNADSHEHIPSIARIIRVISPEECGNIILETVKRPKTEVFHPWLVWFFVTLQRFTPGAVRQLTLRTGRKR